MFLILLKGDFPWIKDSKLQRRSVARWQAVVVPALANANLGNSRNLSSRWQILDEMTKVHFNGLNRIYLYDKKLEEGRCFFLEMFSGTFLG